jgi:hypothetical protein
MASTLMRDDNNKMNKINPTTWTGDFGIPHDGFSKNIFIDGSYTTGISEEPTFYTDPLDGEDDPNRDLSGGMYLKTAQTSPAPFRGFPARKFEYSNGTVTWFRPAQPWHWIGKSTYDDGYTAKGSSSGSNNTIIGLAALALVLYFISRKMKL